MTDVVKPSSHTLLRLAEKRRFEDMTKVLKSGDDEAISTFLNDKERTSAPVRNKIKEIQSSIKFYSSIRQWRWWTWSVKLSQNIKTLVSQKIFSNENGATPLHIALAESCDVAVIRRLLSGPTGTLPAVRFDDDGRKQTNKTVKDKLEIIHLLVKSYPYAKVIRDRNRRTPQDIARKHNADPVLVRALSPTCKQIECYTGLTHAGYTFITR
jgi:hypothetical protein